MSKDKGFTNDAIPALSVCESPIEGRFIQALFDRMNIDGRRCEYLRQSDHIRVTVRFDPSHPHDAEVVLCVQVSPGWLKGKRIDLVVFYSRLGLSVRLSIELDGAEFHRSDEQRSVDRWKDREMLRHGFSPVRYSGKEVYADPAAVVDDVLDIAERLLCSLESIEFSVETKPEEPA